VGHSAGSYEPQLEKQSVIQYVPWQWVGPPQQKLPSSLVPAPVLAPMPAALRIPVVIDAWDAFRQGYRDFGGREGWLEHFVQDVFSSCESTVWGGWYSNGYVSRAQFHPDSWATTVRNTGLVEPTDPYVVGGNVAWWSNAIRHPGSTAGWPTCWWWGNIP